MSFNPRSWLIPAILLIAVLTVYQQVLEHQFTYFDDNAYVFRNPVVLTGLNWRSMEWAFTTGFCSNYHPLTWISHMLDVKLFGLWAGGHAFTSLLWHCANVLLVWQLTRKITGRDSSGVFVALLFAIHPLNVESVANISQRKSVLAAFFGLLSLLLYLRYAERGTRVHYLFSLGATAMSLLAKPLFVTMPALLLLLDYWPLARFPLRQNKPMLPSASIPPLYGLTSSVRDLIAEKIPFVLLACASGLSTVYFQHAAGAMQTAKVDIITSLAAAISSYFFYLEKLFWPSDLAAFYPLPESYSLTLLLISAAVLLTITIASWLVRHNRPYVTFGWLWFLVTLAPMAGFIRVGGMGMADRYAYIPLFGVFLLLVLLATEWWDSLSLTHPTIRRLLLIIGIGCIGFLTIAAHQQVSYWRNTSRLFARIMSTQGPNDRLLNLMGFEAFDQGDFARAIPFFEKALIVTPNNPESITNLGISLFAVGRFTEAEIWLARASKLSRPASVGALNARGKIAEQQGRLNDACRFWRDAITAMPGFGEARRNLAHVLFNNAAADEALAIIDTGIHLTPWDDRLYDVQAEILDAMGRANEAHIARDLATQQRAKNAVVPALRIPSPDEIR